MLPKTPSPFDTSKMINSKEKNIKSAQMYGFANDAKAMIQDYGGDFDSNEYLVSTEKDEMFGDFWSKAKKTVKKALPKPPKFKVGKSPIKGVARSTVGAGRYTVGLAKKLVKKGTKVVAKTVSVVAKPVSAVVAPVMGVVSSIPVVGKIVQPTLQTAVGVVGMVPLVGAPISNIVTDVATKTGIIPNMPVPSGYATAPEEKIAVEPATTPAPMLPSPTYISPAPMVNSPMSQSGSFTPNISSSSMPSGSSSGSEGGGGGGGGYSSSSNAQESVAKEEGTIKSEIKKPVVAPASTGKKLLGLAAVLGAIYVMNK